MPLVFSFARAGKTVSKADPNVDPKISITKTPTLSASTTDAKIVIDYKVVVENDKHARAGYRTVLTDTLYDPQQSVMSNRSWPLDTLEPGDQVTLSYTVEFPAVARAGVYKNVARISGQLNETTYKPMILKMPDTEASAEVELALKPEILGVATAAPEPPPVAACEPLLSSPLRRGTASKSDVLKLQAFLTTQGTPIPLTGTFGPMTSAAVKQFQQKYASDILTPVGLTKPTGNVFGGTIKKINEVVCGGESTAGSFPVSTPIAAAATAPVPPPATPLPVAVTPRPAVKPKPVKKEEVKDTKPVGVLGGWFSQFAPKGKAEK